MTKKSENLVDASVIGDALGVYPATILQWARDGRIPCVRISRRTVRFNLVEIKDYLRERQTPAGVTP